MENGNSYVITFINYADGYPYENFRKVNSWSAKYFGRVNAVIEYSSKDIPLDYVSNFRETFNYKRGAGLWLWKPYIIKDALSKIKDGEWLFYCDSGAVVINKISNLIKCAEDNNTPILLVEQPLINREFTKRETFVGMDVKDHGENQLLSGYILLKKCTESIVFIDEWQDACEHLDWLSPDHFHPEIQEWNDFFSHREDQSTLTLLAIKHKLPVFRDCSDYGKFPHMYFCSKYSYNPKKYPNSNYPTIVLCNRRFNPFKYAARYYLKVFADAFGLIKPDNIIKEKIRRGL